MGTQKSNLKSRYVNFKSVGRLNDKKLQVGDFTKIIYSKCPLCGKVKVEPTYGLTRTKVVYSYCRDGGCLSYVNERESSANFVA